MSARDDHAARVIAGVSEPQCWGALFDEIDQLRAEIYELVHGPDGWAETRINPADCDRADRCPSCGVRSGICGPPDSTHCSDRWHQ